MCSRNSENRSDHATFHVVFIHFERDEKKEAKRRRLNNASLIWKDQSKLLLKIPRRQSERVIPISEVSKRSSNEQQYLLGVQERYLRSNSLIIKWVMVISTR